jgi:hypothetical protein
MLASGIHVFFYTVPRFQHFIINDECFSTFHYKRWKHASLLGQRISHEILWAWIGKEKNVIEWCVDYELRCLDDQCLGTELEKSKLWNNFPAIFPSFISAEKSYRLLIIVKFYTLLSLNQKFFFSKYNNTTCWVFGFAKKKLVYWNRGSFWAIHYHRILLRGIQLTHVQRCWGSTVKMVFSWKFFTFHEANAVNV